MKIEAVNFTLTIRADCAKCGKPHPYPFDVLGQKWICYECKLIASMLSDAPEEKERETLYRLEPAKKTPRPVKVGDLVRRWYSPHEFSTLCVDAIDNANRGFFAGSLYLPTANNTARSLAEAGSSPNGGPMNTYWDHYDGTPIEWPA